MADVWDSALEGPTATHVMAVLANSADDDGTNCFPGTRLIARRTRVSERTVSNTIQELEQGGWLWVIQRGLGRGNRTEYRLNVQRLHEQAEQRREEERKKRCNHFTFSPEETRKRKGETGARKAEAGAGKGEIDVAPLFVLTVSDSPGDPSPPYPLPREGARELELDRAVDQVCSALGIDPKNRRRRRPVTAAIANAAEKGELPATIALDLIAAVKDQAQFHVDGQVKFQFGLDKFLGQGIWRDRNRWSWDTAALRLQAEARVGSR